MLGDPLLHTREPWHCPTALCVTAPLLSLALPGFPHNSSTKLAWWDRDWPGTLVLRDADTPLFFIDLFASPQECFPMEQCHSMSQGAQALFKPKERVQLGCVRLQSSQ